MDPIAKFLYDRDELARPVPTFWWVLVSAVLFYIPFTIFKYSPFLSAVVSVLFVYCSVWVLTYYYYRRFLNDKKGLKKGLNFFTSRWFRVEQFIVYGSALLCLYGMYKFDDFTVNALIEGVNECLFLSLILIWGIYLAEFLLGGRGERRSRFRFNGFCGGPRGVAFDLENRRDV